MSILTTISAGLVIARSAMAIGGFVKKMFGPSQKDIHNCNIDLQRRNAETTLRVAQMNARAALEVADHNAKTSLDVAAMAAQVNKEIAAANIRNTREIAEFNLREARTTAMLAAKLQADLAMRNAAVQDAMRSFPLNIPPCVMLENAGLPQAVLQDGEINIVDANPCGGFQSAYPLNVIITPLFVDSTVKNREYISQRMIDNLYGSIESFFTKYYSRDGERPIRLYNTSWNRNVAAGTHAAELLYYFLKALPVVAIEPRFDGEKFRAIVTHWNLGFDGDAIHRAEYEFPVNFKDMILGNAIKRSERDSKLFSKIPVDKQTQKVKSYIQVCENNLGVYNAISQDVTAEECLQFISVEQSDLKEAADTLSMNMKVLLSAMTDAHHLLSVGTTPILPKLIKTEFPKLLETEQFVESMRTMYEKCYDKLGYNADELSPILKLEYADIAIALGTETGADEVAIAALRQSAKEFCRIKHLECPRDISSQDLIDLVSNSSRIEDEDYLKRLIIFTRDHEGAIPSEGHRQLQLAYRRVNNP